MLVAWLGTTDRRYPVDKIKDTGRGTLANFDQPRQLDIEVQTNMPRRRVKIYLKQNHYQLQFKTGASH